MQRVQKWGGRAHSTQRVECWNLELWTLWEPRAGESGFCGPLSIGCSGLGFWSSRLLAVWFGDKLLNFFMSQSPWNENFNKAIVRIKWLNKWQCLEQCLAHDKHPETLTVISSDEEMFCFSTKKKRLKQLPNSHCKRTPLGLFSSD